MSEVENRLKAAGVELPPAPPPAANYAPAVASGDLLFISGQLPMLDGSIAHSGRVGADLDWETAAEGARICALNILAQAKAALGDLDKIVKVVKIGGFVSCAPEFTDHPKVVNGASDLMIAAFGAEAGMHARFAVGAPSLPLGVAVEIEAILRFSA